MYLIETFVGHELRSLACVSDVRDDYIGLY